MMHTNLDMHIDMCALMSQIDIEHSNIESMHTIRDVCIDTYALGCYFMN